MAEEGNMVRRLVVPKTSLVLIKTNQQFITRLTGLGCGIRSRGKPHLTGFGQNQQKSVYYFFENGHLTPPSPPKT